MQEYTFLIMGDFEIQTKLSDIKLNKMSCLLSCKMYANNAVAMLTCSRVKLKKLLVQASRCAFSF